VWETLVRWDSPDHYGVACKRIDARDDATRSVFNRRATMPAALATLLGSLQAEVVVVSYNDESWLTAPEMTALLRDAGHADVRLLAFDRKRYVGAQIGIHGPTGEKVGTVSHLRNTEFVFVAGPTDRVAAAVAENAALV
jgi:adenine-specific DNA-methyltransferase